MFRLWGKDPLIYISIPIFVAGITKYGDRVLNLWLASSKKRRASGIEVMYEAERVFVRIFQALAFIDISIDEQRKRLSFDRIMPAALYLHEAYLLFEMFKIVFADLGVIHSIHMASYHILKNKDAIEAFKLIEVELGFMYDELFTKVTWVWSPRTILRFISFLSITSALVSFSLMVVKESSYPKIEVIISYLLLGGGVVLEIHAIIKLFLSDWAMLQLSSLRKHCANSVYLAIHSDNNKKWERYMGQHDLVDAQVAKNGNFWTVIKSFLWKLLGMANIQRWEVVSAELKNLIFDYLLEKRSRYSHQVPQPDPGMNDLNEILAERGNQVLQSEGCSAKFRWTLDGFDFHATLLLWHIATDICYYDDVRKTGGDAHNFRLVSCEMSRSLSNYMLYLLSERPNMLPKGIGDIRYEQAGIEVNEFSWCWRTIPAPITKWDSEEFSSQIRKRGSNVSLLNDACKLAKELQSIDGENGWSTERKWKMISKLWVEMLTYAATNCGWREHGQALARGGELLTRVSLLMVHLGLSDQCLTSDHKTNSREV